MQNSKNKPVKKSIITLVIILGAAIFYFLFFMQKDEEIIADPGLTEMEYAKKLIVDRKLKDIEFADSSRSRFNAEERSAFHGLNYFKPDYSYQIETVFTLDTSLPAFKMPTNTERKPNYRIYGYLNFTIHDTACRLTAFQNMDYKDDPVNGGYLFVPFSDKTNGIASYGAGRYIDIPIPTENRIVLDFNMAYNPYCAYSDRWSCPLVPFENYLKVSIPAGEKKYNH